MASGTRVYQTFAIAERARRASNHAKLTDRTSSLAPANPSNRCKLEVRKELVHRFSCALMEDAGVERLSHPFARAVCAA